MLMLQGDIALAPFRLQQTLAKLQRSGFPVQQLQSHYWYYVQENNTSGQENTTSVLTDQQRSQLLTILPGAQFIEPSALQASSSVRVWVVPRLGTISPWSSKATEILHRCGITRIDRIERGICFQFPDWPADSLLDDELLKKLSSQLYDPLTESFLSDLQSLSQLFQPQEPQTFTCIDILGKAGKAALQAANQAMGLALSSVELDYLYLAFIRLGRNPTDVELMMFAQVNSEHCRHKIFNAQWELDGQLQTHSLFDMIRHTYREHPNQVLVAYKDNAAVLQGLSAHRFYLDPQRRQYRSVVEETALVFKVETHNHPTAISPFPGAATGSGGEIRDEAATGRGSVFRAGLAGFSVSHLRIPDFPQPWEQWVNPGKPGTIASALDIMLEGPIGAASFNNEFGRPNIIGYFRTLEMLWEMPSTPQSTQATEFEPEQSLKQGAVVQLEKSKAKRLKNKPIVEERFVGYHKPIMIAGGLGVIAPSQIEKKDLPPGAKLVVLGGPAMAIGLGGGAASSRAAGENTEALDFASVQRANPEMERRCQEVINACWVQEEENPILSIHDVGAGGLSNALPEIVAANQRGAIVDLRAIPNAEPGMSPLGIWCNEAQERFVLAVAADKMAYFAELAEREGCPYAVVGMVTKDQDLILHDRHFGNQPVAVPLSLLLGGELPIPRCHGQRRPISVATVSSQEHATIEIPLSDAIQHVLQFPCVGSKSFLITIGDRSVSGLVARDQMVGPWQVPVADCGVILADYEGYHGAAMAMGERAPIAMHHYAASARMAVGEAITNIIAADIRQLNHISLSANWMAAVDDEYERAGLFEAVQAVGLELCPALGICIPVGKDSLSMRCSWQQEDKHKRVQSPLSLVITAAAPVEDTRCTLTPQLHPLHDDASRLLLIDLGQGLHRLGGSVLTQIYPHLKTEVTPDLDDAQQFKQFFAALSLLKQQNLILAYHDRADGGLLVTLCEMAFAAHVGIDIHLDEIVTHENHQDPLPVLFAEELGAVIQVRSADVDTVLQCFADHQLVDCIHVVGQLNTKDHINIYHQQQLIYQNSRIKLQQLWAETSYRMQALRDQPDCAQQEFAQILDQNDPGISVKLTFDTDENIAAPYINHGQRPQVAILREQGVNGQLEMAAAFTKVGFDCIDVHMNDLIAGHVNLQSFVGLAACGGFSYGDVLGSGRGWAQSILQHESVRDEFQRYFQRKNTFTLGICNGCQMLAQLQELIPGADHWPLFKTNRSEQFEARFLMVKIESSPSIFLQGMSDSYLPIVASHGEGRVEFKDATQLDDLQRQQLIAIRYVDNHHRITENYPANPNGSPQGITGLTTTDGRVLTLMPHPDRVFRTVQNSWHPQEWGEDGPWLRLFQNARVWVG